MSIKTELNDFRFRVKERICAILTDCYMADNGEMPNWGNDEEIVVDGSFVDNYAINIVVSDVHNEVFYNEPQEIEEMRVTLDYNLYFITNDGMNDICWDEVSTDELVELANYMEEHKK